LRREICDCIRETAELSSLLLNSRRDAADSSAELNSLLLDSSCDAADLSSLLVDSSCDAADCIIRSLSVSSVTFLAIDLKDRNRQ
jgi:hypothetical protein